MLAATLLLAKAAFQAHDAATAFDFWIGTWNCETVFAQNAQIHELRATNKVFKTLDGKVLEESFKMDGFEGRSWSVYNSQSKKWQQTWVDSSGGYIVLEGEMKDGKMVLVTLPKPRAPSQFNRMVYENISKDSFDWKWEASTDGGKSWKLNWHLRYMRRRD